MTGTLNQPRSAFVAIGTGVVSDDGSIMKSQPGVGVLKAGWMCNGNPTASGSCENASVAVRPEVLVPVGITIPLVASGGPTPGANPSYSWQFPNSDAANIQVSADTSMLSLSGVDFSSATNGTAITLPLQVQYTALTVRRCRSMPAI